MRKNNLKSIHGKKIRRQGFSIPLVVLYSVMFATPYSIYVISWCMGKFDTYGVPLTFWTSVFLCFTLSVPFLVLRLLNKHFWGKIICVLNDEGIYYADNEKLCWDSIEKIEYAIDSKPRYQSDSGKEWRVIIYTRDGKHVVLKEAPLYIMSSIKKYQKSFDVKITGTSTIVHRVLIIATTLLLSPFYVVLLENAPGASTPQLIVVGVIWAVLGIVRIPIFNIYNVGYRFWRKLLPRKCLSYIVLGLYYSSFFVALVILFYFPNWVVTSLLGVYLGVVQPPVPSRYGSDRYIFLPSYDQLCEIYISKADFWEERIAKRNADRSKKRFK